jgi:hypothetical protein
MTLTCLPQIRLVQRPRPVQDVDWGGKGDQGQAIPARPSKHDGELMACAGWDEGVVQMTLGEKSILTISGYVGLPGKTPSPVRIVLMCIGSDYAYGDR